MLLVVVIVVRVMRFSLGDAGDEQTAGGADDLDGSAVEVAFSTSLRSTSRGRAETEVLLWLM